MHAQRVGRDHTLGYQGISPGSVPQTRAVEKQKGRAGRAGFPPAAVVQRGSVRSRSPIGGCRSSLLLGLALLALG